MKTIIVPMDGSEFAERALAPAGALATRAGADVVVMTSSVGGVVVEPDAYLREAAARAGIADARPVVIRDRGVVGALEVLCADAADPAVCMTTHGRSGVGKALLGSVAGEVIRQGAAPLLLVGPEVDEQLATRFETVIVCTDGSEVSSAIAPVASDWIRMLHLRSWVVQVLDPDVRRQLEQGSETVPETNTAYALAQTLMHHDGAGVNWDVLHGENVAAAIVNYASALRASMIAMATHGRSGLARFALGSVAASVVHSAPCPVLVVRPDGLHMSEGRPLEAEGGDGSPTIEIVVYQHGHEVHRELCESAEAADEVASAWSELPGVECQVDDLATRHRPGEILEPDEGLVSPDEDYPRS